MAANFYVLYAEKKNAQLTIPLKKFGVILIFFNINVISIFVILK